MRTRTSLLVILAATLLAVSFADSGIKRRSVYFKVNGSMGTSTADTLLYDVNKPGYDRVSIADPVTGYMPDSIHIAWSVLDSSSFIMKFGARMVQRPTSSAGLLGKGLTFTTIDTAGKTAETKFNVHTIATSYFSSMDEAALICTGVATNTASPVVGSKGKYTVRLDFFYTVSERQYP